MSFRSGLPSSIMCPDFSKCASLWIGLYAVKIRAEAMQEASEAVPSGMLSVLGQRQSKFSFACSEAQEHCKTLGIENPVCEVSNYLFPDCRVISGHLEVGVDGSAFTGLSPAQEGGTVPCLGAHRSVMGPLPSQGLQGIFEGQGSVWRARHCRWSRDSTTYKQEPRASCPACAGCQGAGPARLQGLPTAHSRLLTA